MVTGSVETFHKSSTLDREYFIFGILSYNQPSFSPMITPSMPPYSPVTPLSTGIHIIADLYECDLSCLDGHDQASIQALFARLISDAALTALGGYVHIFGERACTLVYTLAESHISLHTWPELGYVSLDVFVCNHTRDNSERAYQLYEAIESLFVPKSTSIQTLERSMIAP